LEPRPSIDMLVPLLALPPVEPHLERMKEQGIVVRRPKVWEGPWVREFITSHFLSIWAEEASVAFANKPISQFIALDGAKIVGFAAYECTYRGLFGPTGVDPACRNRGIAAALLLKCLWSMREMGYIYAIIGLAGPREFFEKSCGAIAVPDDWPQYIFEG